ncbi:hypothetical protein SAMN02787142_3024 [Burkholderia sp. WP9]|uniref:hypothetical protein n=1 Tax=Burkholderia sp. WP9 TaxID=1500263 RepID=UPI00089A5BD2|nr:hypothetical protein [Burkholderia sp. WP9]SED35418.1 hypothetical protein SAMN02787142_3024 [Burkholderia sp. WP9]
MQKDDERIVMFFDIKVETYASLGRAGKLMGLKAHTLADLFKIVKTLRAADDLLSMKNRKSTEMCYLADLRLDDDLEFLVLLINRSDKAAPNFVLSDPVKRQRREIIKRKDEGADYSAHLAIRLVSVAPQTYRAILEVSPGLPSAKITAYLNHVMRLCDLAFPQAFHRPHPDGSVDRDGNPRIVKARHRFELRGHPSTGFFKDLESGKLEGIELLDDKHKDNPWDANGYIVEEKRSVFLHESHQKIKGRIIDAVKSVCAEARKKSFDRMRVKFKTQDEISRTVTLETESAQIADDERYVKKETIRDFPAPLPASFEVISTEISERMCVLLKG